MTMHSPYREYLALHTDRNKRLRVYREIFSTHVEGALLTDIGDAVNKDMALGEERFGRCLQDSASIVISVVGDRDITLWKMRLNFKRTAHRFNHFTQSPCRVMLHLARKWPANNQSRLVYGRQTTAKRGGKQVRMWAAGMTRLKYNV